LARALTQDPNDRYQTAYDLGRDLNGILFRMGRAVSSFDIARLVAPVVAEREAKHRARQQEKGAVIGSLIEEVLFEFSSLDADEADSGSGREVGSSPLNIDAFENVQDWATDLGDLRLDSEPRAQNAASSFEVGNLAALEEDGPSLRRSQVSYDTSGPTAAEPSPSELPAPDGDPAVPSTPRSTEQRPGSHVGITVAVVLVAILAALLAAAFTGIIPPDLLPEDLRRLVEG
jgi:hypothetical protein